MHHFISLLIRYQQKTKFLQIHFSFTEDLFTCEEPQSPYGSPLIDLLRESDSDHLSCIAFFPLSIP